MLKTEINRITILYFQARLSELKDDSVRHNNTFEDAAHFEIIKICDAKVNVTAA